MKKAALKRGRPGFRRFLSSLRCFMDTSLAAVDFRDLFGNGFQFATAVIKECLVQIALYVVRQKFFLDKDVYVLSLRYLERPGIFYPGAIVEFTSHRPHLLLLIASCLNYSTGGRAGPCFR